MSEYHLRTAHKIQKIDITVPVGSITVVADPAYTETTLQLAPWDAEDEIAIKAIDEAIVEQDGTTLVVRLKDSAPQSARGGISINQVGGRSSVRVNGRSVVVTGRNITVVNGQIVSGGFGNGHVLSVGYSGAVKAILHVSSGIDAKLLGEEIMVSGYLGTVEAETENGDIRLDGCVDLDVETRNGNITVGSVRRVTAETHNGDLVVTRIHDRAELLSHNGRIVAHTETDDFKARTHNGNIRVTHESGVVIPDKAVKVHNGKKSVRAR